MTHNPRIPDADTRAKNVRQMREARHQLDLVTLELDELIAMIETDLRRQRWERLQKNKRFDPKNTN